MNKIYQLVQDREEETGILVVGTIRDISIYLKNLWLKNSDTIRDALNIQEEEEFYYQVDMDLNNVVNKLYLDLFEVGEVELKIPE